MKRWWLMVSCAVCCLCAHGAYEVDVFLRSGASVKADKIERIEGFLVLGLNGRRVSLDVVDRVEFRFRDLSVEMCAAFYESGRVSALKSRLDQLLLPLVKLRGVASNLAPYWFWLVRCEYWEGSRAGALRGIEVLREERDSSWMRSADMYAVLLALDDKDVAGAEAIYRRLDSPEKASVPMNLYLLGRLAMARGEWKESLQYMVQIVALHGRNREWLAPAIFAEAELYQRLGSSDLVLQVVRELEWTFPESEWVAKGRELLN